MPRCPLSFCRVSASDVQHSGPEHQCCTSPDTVPSPFKRQSKQYSRARSNSVLSSAPSGSGNNNGRTSRLQARTRSGGDPWYTFNFRSAHVVNLALKAFHAPGVPKNVKPTLNKNDSARPSNINVRDSLVRVRWKLHRHNADGHPRFRELSIRSAAALDGCKSALTTTPVRGKMRSTITRALSGKHIVACIDAKTFEACMLVTADRRDNKRPLMTNGAAVSPLLSDAGNNVNAN